MTLMRMRSPAASGEAMQQAADLAARGYRRISNRYCIVARIDRADWLEVLAERYRALCEAITPAARCDLYRRALSADRLEVDAQVARLVPSSVGDECGYIEEAK